MSIYQLIMLDGKYTRVIFMYQEFIITQISITEILFVSERLSGSTIAVVISYDFFCLFVVASVAPLLH